MKVVGIISTAVVAILFLCAGLLFLLGAVRRLQRKRQRRLGAALLAPGDGLTNNQLMSAQRVPGYNRQPLVQMYRRDYGIREKGSPDLAEANIFMPRYEEMGI